MSLMVSSQFLPYSKTGAGDYRVNLCSGNVPRVSPELHIHPQRIQWFIEKILLIRKSGDQKSYYLIIFLLFCWMLETRLRRRPRLKTSVCLSALCGESYCLALSHQHESAIVQLNTVALILIEHLVQVIGHQLQWIGGITRPDL